MADREVLTVDETAVLADAQVVTGTMLERTGFPNARTWASPGIAVHNLRVPGG